MMSLCSPIPGGVWCPILLDLMSSYLPSPPWLGRGRLLVFPRMEESQFDGESSSICLKKARLCLEDVSLF